MKLHIVQRTQKDQQGVDNCSTRPKHHEEEGEDAGKSTLRDGKENEEINQTKVKDEETSQERKKLTLNGDGT